MNEAKITKCIDELGRLGIPKHMRQALGVKDGEPVELYLDGNTLIIKRVNNGCIFCENSEALTLFNAKYVCSDCISKLQNA